MMVASILSDPAGWDYLEGDYWQGLSIANARYDHLRELDLLDGGITLALHDGASDKWTTWRPFTGGFTFEELRYAYDVHRSVLSNEVVIESDYPTYEQNQEAARFIGRILEEHGWSPQYYYSGSKSIHIHVYFDWTCLLALDKNVQKTIMEKYLTKSGFVKAFMAFLRKKLISCYGLKSRTFDPALVKSSHLIRAALSRNKLGYKTYVGNTYKDLSIIPYLCNEENRIYPLVEPIILSKPHDVFSLVEEFLEEKRLGEQRRLLNRKEASLLAWLAPERFTKVRPCVEAILSDDFKAYGDGFQRGMFILLNELRRLEGRESAFAKLLDWNQRMGSPVQEEDIRYRLGEGKEYTLSCAYIHEFLRSIGAGAMAQQCGRKI